MRQYTHSHPHLVVWSISQNGQQILDSGWLEGALKGIKYSNSTAMQHKCDVSEVLWSPTLTMPSASELSSVSADMLLWASIDRTYRNDDGSWTGLAVERSKHSEPTGGLG